MAKRTTLFRRIHGAGFVGFVGPLLIALVSASSAAAAPPTLGGGDAGPEEQACAGRASGDACSLPNNQLGTCQPGTCNRLDYSGGSPPKATEVSCIVCKPGAAQPQPQGSGEGAVEPGADAGASSPAESGDKEPPQSSSRCRLGGNSFDLAGLAVLAGLLAVRRRRRDQ